MKKYTDLTEKQQSLYLDITSAIHADRGEYFVELGDEILVLQTVIDEFLNTYQETYQESANQPIECCTTLCENCQKSRMAEKARIEKIISYAAQDITCS